MERCVVGTNSDLSPIGFLQNSTIQHYTQYQPSDLSSCVKELHRLCSNNHNSSLPAIREKYSQHKVREACINLSFDYIFSLWIWLMVLCLFFSVQICCEEVCPSNDTLRVFSLRSWCDREHQSNILVGRSRTGVRALSS